MSITLVSAWSAAGSTSNYGLAASLQAAQQGSARLTVSGYTTALNATDQGYPSIAKFYALAADRSMYGLAPLRVTYAVAPLRSFYSEP